MSIVLNIKGLPKPRMTRADKYQQRDAVLKYWDYKKQLKDLATQNNLVVTGSFSLFFVFALPPSYSRSKQKSLIYTPHLLKPDLDNLLKGFQDALCEQDNYIFEVRAAKYWGEKNSIVYDDKISAHPVLEYIQDTNVLH